MTPNVTNKTKTRKYDKRYFALSFTNTVKGNEERAQCVVCLKTLATDSMKPNKLRCHLEISHLERKEKPIDFFTKKYSTVTYNRIADIFNIFFIYKRRALQKKFGNHCTRQAVVCLSTYEPQSRVCLTSVSTPYRAQEQSISLAMVQLKEVFFGKV